MKTVLAIALSLALPAAAAKEEMEVRSLEAMRGKQAGEDLRKLDGDLAGALALVDTLQEPIARGASPKSADRRQRGGTPEVQQLRAGIKAAWERLEQAKGDLDKVARAYDTTTRLPEP
jgi:hypothetical protein